MRLLQTVIGLFLVGLALIGCATPVDFGDPFAKDRPADVDLPGLYLPTRQTLVSIEKGGYARGNMSIELRADGTFQFQNIPDWWRTPNGKPSGGFDSGSGKWQTVQDSTWWSLELDFPSCKGFAQPDEGGTKRKAHLLGQAPPYEIMLTVGGYDGGRMRFRSLKDPSPRP